MIEHIITFISFVVIIWAWTKQGGARLSLKETSRFFTVVLSIITILVFTVSLVSMVVRGELL